MKNNESYRGKVLIPFEDRAAKKAIVLSKRNR